ncbi:MAG: hypothetical protein V1706_01640 [Pseudomonadota bacterium]
MFLKKLFADPTIKELQQLGYGDYGASTFEKFKEILPKLSSGILESSNNTESLINAMIHAERNSSGDDMLSLARLSANSSLIVKAISKYHVSIAVNEVHDMVRKAPPGQRRNVYHALQANNFIDIVFSKEADPSYWLNSVQEMIEEDSNRI